MLANKYEKTCDEALEQLENWTREGPANLRLSTGDVRGVINRSSDGQLHHRLLEVGEVHNASGPFVKKLRVRSESVGM